MLAWAIDAAKASGADRIVTVLSRDSTSTQDWLGQQEFAIQHPPLGTGHAVLAARETLADFDGVGLVMFADTPLVTSQTLAALAARVAAGQDIAILGFETPRNQLAMVVSSVMPMARCRKSSRNVTPPVRKRQSHWSMAVSWRRAPRCCSIFWTALTPAMHRMRFI